MGLRVRGWSIWRWVRGGRGGGLEEGMGGGRVGMRCRAGGSRGLRGGLGKEGKEDCGEANKRASLDFECGRFSGKNVEK